VIAVAEFLGPPNPNCERGRRAVDQNEGRPARLDRNPRIWRFEGGSGIREGREVSIFGEGRSGVRCCERKENTWVLGNRKAAGREGLSTDSGEGREKRQAFEAQGG